MKKLILLPVKVLILGLILISALPAFATTYYVRTVGNDSNGGTTKNTAFKTITKAITVSIPGDTVYIGSGTYNKALSVESKAGTSNSQINIVGDTTGAFTGDSAGEIIVTSLETAPAGSYTLVPGKNFTWFGAASNQWGYMIGQNYNGDLRLLNQINSTDATCTGEVENVEGSWTVFGGKFYVHAYGGGNPGNSTIYTATSRNLMTISNSTYINVSGLTFKAGGCGIAITGATTGHLNLFKLNFDYLANAIRFDGNANSQTNIHDSVFSNLIRYPNVAIAGTE